MNPEGQTLIALQDVTKVFTTDEVETHALAGHRAEDSKRRVRLHFRPFGLRQIHLLAILGLLDTPSDGSYVLNDTRVDQMKLSRARAHPQPRNRLHLPGLQPDRRSHRV